MGLGPDQKPYLESYAEFNSMHLVNKSTNVG